MTYTIQLQRGDDSTNLTAGVYAISYTPKSGGAAETVLESSVVRVLASSVATMQTAIRDIEEHFYMARRRRQKGTGDRVYITFLESGDSDTYRSEIWANNPDDLPGRVVVLEETMHQKFSDNYVAKLQVIWERRNYWEFNSEVELALTNSYGSGTGGLLVACVHRGPVIDDSTLSFDDSTEYITDGGDGWDHIVGDIIEVRDSTSNDGVYSVADFDDSSAWVETNEPLTNEAASATIEIYDIMDYSHIADSDILGNLPTPLKLKITQTDSDITAETFWIGQKYTGSPKKFPHLLEFEDSDDSTAVVSDDSCSGTEYKTYSVTTSEVKIAWWTLPASMVSAADSGYFKALVRFRGLTDITNIKLRLKMSYNSQVLWEGGQVEYDDTYQTPTQWREVDTLRLPPFKLDGGTPTTIVLELWAISTTGSTETPSLDCLKLMPVDGFVKLTANSGLAEDSVLVFDGILDDYYQEVSSAKVKDVSGEGQPFMLWPNDDSRIYYTWNNDDDSTTDAIDSTITVQAFHRPRKATL